MAVQTLHASMRRKASRHEETDVTALMKKARLALAQDACSGVVRFFCD